MGWSSLFKTALKYSGRAAKATVTSAGRAVIHPQTTIKGLGTATKAAVVGGGAAYVGWKKLTTDKSVVGIVSDAVIGEKATDTVSDTISGAVQEVKDLKDSVSNLTDNVSNAVDGVSNSLTDVNSKWSGMSNFLRGIFSGNGIDMIGNFFGNLGKSNVSGLSLAGLVLSSLLVFGRFGWMGKIAGAVLGMMMIGNNANMSHVLSPQKKESQSQDSNETDETKKAAKASQQKQQQEVQSEPFIPEEEREVIHRGR